MSKQPSDPSRAEASEPAGPLDGIYQMQREILKLNLEASSYLTRYSTSLFVPRQMDVLPSAPMQLFAFFNDCARLSLSPVNMMAASAMSPVTQFVDGLARVGSRNTRSED